MRKGEREVIIDKAASIIDLADHILTQEHLAGALRDYYVKAPNGEYLSLQVMLTGIRGEANTLKMWAEAPSMCAECHGSASNCTVCGGRAKLKEDLKARKS